jgi:hypothetical protein
MAQKYHSLEVEIVLLYLSILLHSRILHTQYIQSFMQLKILFIPTLTRHVSASVGHHQVFLLKMFHCNFISSSFDIHPYLLEIVRLLR